MNIIEKNNFSYYDGHYSNEKRSFEEFMLAYNMMKVIRGRHYLKNILVLISTYEFFSIISIVNFSISFMKFSALSNQFLTIS